MQLTPVPQPSGNHAEEMISGGAWPSADEFIFVATAHEYLAALQKLFNKTSSPWSKAYRDTFENGGGMWAGDAAGVAGKKGSDIQNSIAAQARYLSAAAQWNERVAQLINQTKTSIADNVRKTQGLLEGLSDENQQSWIKLCHTLNRGLVSAASGEVAALQDFRPPANAENLAHSGLSIDPPASIPSTPSAPLPQTSHLAVD